MNQRELLLVSMAAAKGESYQAVQIQKLIFLLEKKTLGRSVFDFKPEGYGPFDPTIFHLLDQLAAEGFVEIYELLPSGERRYRLKPTGEELAIVIWNSLPCDMQKYFVILSQWVRSLPFHELVGAIYKAYPDMRVNSVFGDPDVETS